MTIKRDNTRPPVIPAPMPFAQKAEPGCWRAPLRKLIAWGVLAWTALIGAGTFYGIVNTMLDPESMRAIGSSNDFEAAGSAVGIMLGLVFWGVLWLMVVAPAMVAYVLIGKPDK
jgi:hypothetical protein